MTLLIALAVISVVTAATLVSLRVVSQESELQGRERHSREAFFAAEAGLAEGREVLTMLLAKHSDFDNQSSAYQEKASNFTDVMFKLGTLMASKPGFNTRGEVDEANFPGTGRSWYEVIPNTPYTLLPGVGGASGAVDPTFSKAGEELRDVNNKPYLSFPEQRNVTYRVFVHDDEDEGAFVANDPRIDNNHAVWVVSVGEVRARGKWCWPARWCARSCSPTRCRSTATPVPRPRRSAARSAAPARPGRRSRTSICPKARSSEVPRGSPGGP
ncbi:hypothetical protein ACN28S_23025 [Cystobacter fuscus]